MFPTLFDSSWIGLTGSWSFTLASYFVAIMVGYLGAAILTSREAVSMGIDRARYQDFLIWMLILGVLGARIMHVFVDGFFTDYVNLCLDPMALDGVALSSADPCTSNLQCMSAQDAGRDIGAICNPEDGLCYPQADCLRPLKFWAGGLTVYGALLACTVFAYFYIKRHKLGWPRIADLCGYGVPFGIFVGRLGCLAGGCCFGAVCEVTDPWALHFPIGSTPYQQHYDLHFHALSEQYKTLQASLPVYPTQFISSAYNFVIFVIAYFVVRPRKRFHGQVLLTTAILYGICRFMIEFLRADYRGGALGLSTSQLVSIPIIAACGVLLYTKWKAAREEGVESAGDASEDA